MVNNQGLTGQTGEPMRGSLRSRDAWAGLLIMVIGGLALWLSANLAMGQSLRMGPGYVPRLLAGAVVALGQSRASGQP